MKKISIDTRAKINLTLDILGKRLDGYHNVSMVMQSISLSDTLHFKLTDKDIKISCNNCYLPTDEKNIVYRAAQLLREKYNISQGVEVHIEKRIPFAAGLAGGSSNGAGTLIALNSLWDLHLGNEKLLKLGSKVGADVPFCMMGGTALAEGIGEKLTVINDLPEFDIVLVKPNIQISTPWAYSLIDVQNIKAHPDNTAMIEAIKIGNKEEIALNLGNVFEDVVFDKYPELMHIKESLKKLGALGVLMSGSGPTLYGLFTNELSAQSAKEVLLRDYEEVFAVRSYNEGGIESWDLKMD
ncbi:4-(cytidine 5'-diphospho)-2-C-methyl-D-erythritol kinase [Alkalibaculum sp. M08DMB]|uniref:4-diphosphocytidyl-2-C-methyl-D-erythritol kinase n=1 Tax=Alkalibaculum sporogenes TaxID=2655001 RepID=A0A6A7K6K0_9FIRM|nr:4-(cytidine 5'-diphospho)-2-C-methyl-D-erythritol kinase [Alkalibaculum sporogenes]MPW25056.1 4-(cytidine 5'-diphospho)-2-C-methyl-D-erythritol kinase [Alkalibaculum sporogenes]